MVFISHRSWNSSRRLLACSEDRPSLRLKLEPPAPDSGGGVPDIGCSGKHDDDGDVEDDDDDDGEGEDGNDDVTTDVTDDAQNEDYTCGLGLLGLLVL